MPEERHTLIDHTLTDHGKRLVLLEESFKKMELEMVKSTAQQTLDLERATTRQTVELKDSIGKISNRLIYIGVWQTAMFVALGFLFRYVFKVI